MKVLSMGEVTFPEVKFLWKNFRKQLCGLYLRFCRGGVGEGDNRWIRGAARRSFLKKVPFSEHFGTGLVSINAVFNLKITEI